MQLKGFPTVKFFAHESLLIEPLIGKGKFFVLEHVKYCYGISEAAVHGAATEGIITMDDA